MRNKKFDLLVWKSFPRNKPAKTGRYLVKWNSPDGVKIDFKFWECETPYGDHRNDYYYWLGIENFDVIAFAKKPKQ